MLKIFQKKTIFFDLLEELAKHVLAGAEAFRTLASDFPAGLREVRRIHDEEQQADDVMHRVLDHLQRAFLPPMDRDDVHALAGNLDDILDLIDAMARRFDLFHIDAMEAGFAGQASVLTEAVTKVSEAVHTLRQSIRLSDLAPSLAELHRLEHVGDENNYAALTKLFDGRHPALYVLKWKEIYGYVEDAIDACDDVANTLERIALKA